MNPETSPVVVDSPYGKLYVAVIRAEEDRIHDSERGWVTELRPRVRVASDPGFEADPSHADHWTIRGRAYAVHQTVYRHDLRHVVYGNGANGGLWHTQESPHRGGFRNDKRRQVEFRTPTWDLMRNTMHAALDEFHRTNKGWEEFSTYLLLKGKRDSEVNEAVRLRAEASEHETRAVRLAGEMAPIFDRLSPSLVSRLRN